MSTNVCALNTSQSDHRQHLILVITDLIARDRELLGYN